jgi:hypothetical protein
LAVVVGQSIVKEFLHGFFTPSFFCKRREQCEQVTALTSVVVGSLVFSRSSKSWWE